MDAFTESPHSKHHQTYVTKLNEALATNAERPACYQQYSGGHYSKCLLAEYGICGFVGPHVP